MCWPGNRWPADIEQSAGPAIDVDPYSVVFEEITERRADPQSHSVKDRHCKELYLCEPASTCFLVKETFRVVMTQKCKCATFAVPTEHPTPTPDRNSKHHPSPALPKQHSAVRNRHSQQHIGPPHVCPACRNDVREGRGSIVQPLSFAVTNKRAKYRETPHNTFNMCH